jgi:3-hydroxy-9,10-secoandrosta-1,3,5(10)-triene-9,17-dione monooxygenase
MIVENEGLDGPHFFLVPKSDAEVIDDWQVMSLAGTGSKTFVIADKFIPAHRFLDGRQSRAGTGPGTAINKAAVYRMPRFSGVAAAGFSALAIGMARGVLAEWLAYMGRAGRAASPSARSRACMCWRRVARRRSTPPTR